MCPTLRYYDDAAYFTCIVCLRDLWPGDNDWPFCSPTCRQINEDTSVLLLTGPPSDPAQVNNGR